MLELLLCPIVSYLFVFASILTLVAISLERSGLILLLVQGT